MACILREWVTGAAHILGMDPRDKVKYYSSWDARARYDPAERFTWDMEIVFPAGYRAVSNGRRKYSGLKNGMFTAYYVMDKPVPYYLLFVAVGNWKFSEDSVAGIPYENFFYADTGESPFCLSL